MDYKADKVRNLVDKLNTYRDAYYNQDFSIVSDKEYDELFDELAALENETGIVYANSPTTTVGYEAVSKLVKVKHNHPLLSLGKTTDVDEFIKYFGNQDICLMAKMDGLTASIKYVDGKLVSAESRGNGEVGEDITHNAKTFVNLPATIPFKGEIVVDGECIIDYYAFNEINRTENTQYKNPRNLVSGTVRQLDNKVAAKRKVKFIAWKLHSIKDENGVPLYGAKTVNKSFETLKLLGFEVVPYVRGSYILSNDSLRKFSIEDDIDVLRAECERLYYPIDGIVGTFDDIKYGDSLGSTGHHPKHSLAFKFYQERNETTLVDIEWNTTRTGLVNPVAIVEPVEIDGTTVSKSSLSNVSIIKELELGIDDTLTIIKANQIIPMVTDNLTRSNNYQIPSVCPSCGEPLELRNDNGREMLYCVNENCPAINLDKISNFTSREAMNIIGVSDERLKTLMEYGYITDFVSLYNLEKYHNEIEKIEGFGKSSVNNLLKAIDDSKNCKFANVLVAIGIPGIGKSTAKTLSKYCLSIKEADSIFSTFINLACSNHDWTVLKDFGVVMSNAINDYVLNNFDKIAPLISVLNIAEDNEEVSTNNKLDGKTFCITGKLIQYVNRDKLVEDIEKYGGKVVSGVTAKTNFLITNDPTSGSSKNQKAIKFGTKIITENELVDMLKNNLNIKSIKVMVQQTE